MWGLLVVSLVKDQEGRPVYAIGMIEDITERKRAEEERQRSLEQLRALAARLQSIREEERKRVAREIHDQLGQALTAIKIELSSLVRELPAAERPPSKRTSSILNWWMSRFGRCAESRPNCGRECSTTWAWWRPSNGRGRNSSRAPGRSAGWTFPRMISSSIRSGPRRFSASSRRR